MNAGHRAAEVVRAGQALGTPGTLGTSGTLHVCDDPFPARRLRVLPRDSESQRGEPRAVSDRRRQVAVRSHLVERAAFVHELVEPFATNPRDLAFPASRTWTRAGGDGPAGIRFTRRSARVADYEYALLAESGTVIETGTVAIDVTARPYPLDRI